jgi:hypothetical protein
LELNLPYIFLKKKEGERDRARGRRRRSRKKGTSLPLKTDLALVIYKILENTLVP